MKYTSIFLTESNFQVVGDWVMVAILSCDSAENNLCTTSGQRLRCCQRSQWPDMVARSFTAVTQEGEAEGSLGV